MIKTTSFRALVILFVICFVAQVFIVSYFAKHYKCVCNNTKELLEKAAEDVHRLRSRLKQLERQSKETKANSLIRRQSRRISFLEDAENVSTMFKKKRNLYRPQESELANDKDLFGQQVTVIMYLDQGVPYQCLDSRKKEIQKDYPKMQILTIDNPVDSPTVGFQFNSLISKVKTKYFFFLDARYELMEHTSDQSPGWLLHALENVPELDFVSGSILENGKLEIPCYRLKLCNWTLSQRYEYKASIGDLMVCEAIASSFIGRTATIINRWELQLDENMTSLSIIDFFLKSKKLGALSGVRPEVMLEISEKQFCKKKVPNKREKYERLLPIAHKHKVFRFKDSELNEIDLCNSNSPILGEDICDEKVAHEVMLGGGHWAYNGTYAYPFILNNIQACLFKVADILTAKNIPFAIDGGVALGSVKMRKILPWDAGDADIKIYDYSIYEVYKIIEELVVANNYTIKKDAGIGLIQVYCTSPGLFKKIGGLVSLDTKTFFEKPKRFVQMKVNGKWIPFSIDLFRNLRENYDLNYLQHFMYESNERIHCKMSGHNACLPDFRIKKVKSTGIAGTYREHFCDL